MLRLDQLNIVRPETVAEVIATLADNPGAMLIAGGTDLVPKLKRGQFTPSLLVSLDRVTDLDRITSSGDAVTIGARVTIRAIERYDGLDGFGGVKEAARLVATPVIRNSGTLGGNLLQDTRCRYYDRGEFWREAVGYCLKKDGDECRVAPGGGRCFATLCSDMAPALIVHNATVTLAGVSQRTVPLEDIYCDDGIEYTDLENEILLSVTLTHKNLRSTYKKLRARDGWDFPETGVAVSMSPEGDKRAVKVAVTGIGPRPFVFRDEVAADELERIADKVFKSIKPVDTMYFPPAYRKKVTRQFVLECLNELFSAG